MKKIILLTTLLLCCVTLLKAQTASILDVNKTSTVNLVVDFSNALIHNMSEAEFAEYEEDYHKDMPVLIGKLIQDFNYSNNYVNFIIGKFPNSAYTLKVDIISVSIKGDILSNSSIIDNEGNVIASVNDLYAKGGHIGTKLNLIGDGMYRTGKLLARSFGEIIYQQERQEKRSQR